MFFLEGLIDDADPPHAGEAGRWGPPNSACMSGMQMA